jgi:hypothetical protein
LSSAQSQLGEGDIRIGVGTSLASVDNVEVLQWESKLSRELVDSRSEVTLGERSELVE